MTAPNSANPGPEIIAETPFARPLNKLPKALSSPRIF